MICALDDFLFESMRVNVSDIKQQSSYPFASHQPIDDFAIWQATGKHKKNITLHSKLIQQSNAVLDDLHHLAEQKQPVTLAFEDGRALTVLITDIDTEQSDFLSDGKFLKQDFEVKLEVVYGNL